MKAMILAAGRGERLRPLTDKTPKPLIEVGGKTLIVRHIESLRRVGVRDFVINLGWQGEKIRAALGDGRGLRVSIEYSEEGWPALESGGGIHRALPLLGHEPFLVVNGDVYTNYPWRLLVDRAARMPRAALAHLVLVENPPHHREGDFALAAGLVRNEGDEFHTFSGISIHRPELFERCKPGRFPLAPLWRKAAKREQVTGEFFAGAWSDVGTPGRLEALRSGLARTAG